MIELTRYDIKRSGFPKGFSRWTFLFFDRRLKNPGGFLKRVVVGVAMDVGLIMFMVKS